jgi:aldose 1-epimerase
MVHLHDGDASVAINTAFGNNAYSMTFRGEEILWTPPDWHAPSLAGIPMLAPWANRIDGEAYFANGKKYLLNPWLGNLRYDSNHLPIHGLLAFTDRWKLVFSDASTATSRLEFWRFPDWMAQFPFAHALEVTHRLRGGSLEVETAVENLCNQPLPLCIGYHPYFQLTGSPRDEWTVRIAARDQVVLSEKLIPTPERKPVALADPFPLKGESLDTVFTGLTGEDFVLEGPGQRVSVRYGPKFPVAIVYAPLGRGFVCFEPMTALTNAFNLENAGLQHVAPGGTWRESFWITAG